MGENSTDDRAVALVTPNDTISHDPMKAPTDQPKLIEEVPSKVQHALEIPHTPHNDKFGIETVDIHVGPPNEEQVFRVHKKRLCRRIPFFEKMFASPFIEGITQVARFPDDDPAVFDVLLEWVYNFDQRKLRSIFNEPVVDGQPPKATGWDAIALYHLAEKLVVPEVMDHCVDAIVRYHTTYNKLPDVDFIHETYERTTAQGKLRQYAIRSMVYAHKSNITHGDSSMAEVEAMMRDSNDILTDYLKLCPFDDVGDPRKPSRCQYHVHKKWEVCPTTGKRYGLREDGTARRKRGADEDDTRKERKDGKRQRLANVLK